MLEINLSARLSVPDILPLPYSLLHELVWHEEADDVVPHAHTQPVARRKIPFVGSGEPRRVSAVGVIRQYRRIQIAVCVKPFATQGESICFACIGNSCRAVHCGKTSAARVQPPVPSRLCI